MKQTYQVQKYLAATSMALALTCWNGLAAATGDIMPPPGAMQPGGDTSDTTCSYGTWWSDNGAMTQSFDNTKHSAPSISGSMHVVMDCYGNTVNNKSANLACGNWFSAMGNQGWLGAGGALVIDVSAYQSLTFDIYTDPTLNSNITSISISLWDSAYGQLSLGSVSLTNAAWQHVVLPIPSTATMTKCVGYGPYAWYNTDATTPPGHLEYWMDNVKLVSRPVSLPPPALGMAPINGSRLYLGSGVADGGGARQGIYTMSQVPWIGQASAANPITYSMTIASVPNPAIYPNYQAQIFLVAGAPSGTAAADWNYSDMGFLQIADNANGTAYGRLMWKTNEPNGNTMLWNTQDGGQYGTNGWAAGTLVQFNATNMVGTWALTFTSDTAVTITGPGLSTNINIPADWINSFSTAGSGQMYANFGVQPNAATNASQPVCFSRARVSGGASSYAIDDDFTTPPLNTTLWGKAASDGSAIGVVATNAVCWVNWGLPDNGFDLMTTATVADKNSWVSLLNPSSPLPTAISVFQWDSVKRVAVPANDLANPKQAFFCMLKRVASRLQVLLPGETNAPGTVTGKVGTLLPQAVGAAFDVTVNACDSTWHIASSCSDTVAITSSDTGAWLPPNPTLVSGTVTITGNFYFGNPGTWTVTASDVTTPTITSGTSTALTVQ